MSLLVSLLVIGSCTRKESKDCERCHDIRECPQCPIGLSIDSVTKPDRLDAIALSLTEPLPDNY